MDSSAMTSLYESLRQLTTISEEFFNALRQHIVEESYSKNTEIHAKTLKKNAVYFIYSGLCKTSYFNELGKEVVTGFWWERMFLITKDQQVPVEEDHLLFLEDTLLVSISHPALEALFTNFNLTRTLSQRLYAIERRRLRQRAEILMLPAIEGYAEFLRHFPTPRLKLQDIAHFMGIRPFTLSRIRGRIS
jgi:CRP-like cAMP-binding protein